jgi:uncharacterized membrane protein YidH (DUF202 family)
VIERQPQSSIADLDRDPSGTDSQRQPERPVTSAEQAAGPDKGKKADKADKAARRVFGDTQDAEKMLLRWVRASLALMGTGVGIDRALVLLSASAPMLDPLYLLRLAGQLLTLVGMSALWVACYQHWQTVKRIRADEPLPTFKIPLALSVGVAVSVLGVIALMGIVAYR